MLSMGPGVQKLFIEKSSGQVTRFEYNFFSLAALGEMKHRACADSGSAPAPSHTPA